MNMTADSKLKRRQLEKGKKWEGGKMNIPIIKQGKVLNKKERAYWKRKVKVLSPKKGDILIVPAEAHFDFGTLSEAIRHTPILYALIVPEGNASLMDREESVRFAKMILAKESKHGRKKTKK